MKTIAVFSLLLVAACGDSTTTPPPAPTTPTGPTGPGPGDPPAPGNIVALAAANAQFSSLVAAVTRAQLGDALSAATPKKTVFAPTNEAFAALLQALGKASVDELSIAQLQAVLLYHVVGSEIRATAATTAAQSNAVVDTLGGKVKLSFADGKIKLDNDATVTSADIVASNGVIHVIDRVLLPSITDVVTTQPALTNLTAALTAVESSAGFAATLDNDAANPKFTVFAPNDAAFAALVGALAGNTATGVTALTSFTAAQLIPILKLHVANSAVPSSAATSEGASVTALGGRLTATSAAGKVTINGVEVVTADILASNGIVHIITGVLLPSIAEIVLNNAEFSGLAALVAAADPAVATALSGTTNFTLFAPNNAAIAAVGSVPPNVTDILLYHAVTEGAPTYAATALALEAPLELDTALAGQTLTVSQTANTTVTVQDSTSDVANVTVANYFARNGVIHIVNKVLLPHAP